MTVQRKNKFSKPRLQLRMIGMFLAISGFAAIGQALLLSQSLMDLGLDLKDPQAAHTVQEAMPALLAQNLIWTMLFLLPFSLLVGMHVTHRVAGPAYRIEEHLRGIGEGEDPLAPCSLRENDELQELAEAINGAFATLSHATENPTPDKVSA